MISIKPEDVLHKAQLVRLLTAVSDNPKLAKSLFFKGGTCASMLGYLDRFSIDLDFDLKNKADKKGLRLEFKKIFKKLDFLIENENAKTLLFILKYNAPKNQRNTLKLSVVDLVTRSNIYQPAYLAEIDRIMNCQTIETMFANKLVAPLDRFAKHEKIAGRDVYDIHHFFTKGYSFGEEIIEERMKLSVENFIKKLIEFIEDKINEKVLSEDLNTLLPYEKFQKIRKILKQETMMFLRTLIT